MKNKKIYYGDDYKKHIANDMLQKPEFSENCLRLKNLIKDWKVKQANNKKKLEKIKKGETLGLFDDKK